MGTEWERDGNGVGVGSGTPFRDKPPRLSRKGALRAGSSINAPLRDNRGGLSRKGVLGRLLYQPFIYFMSYLFIPIVRVRHSNYEHDSL